MVVYVHLLVIRTYPLIVFDHRIQSIALSVIVWPDRAASSYLEGAKGHG